MSKKFHATTMYGFLPVAGRVIVGDVLLSNSPAGSAAKKVRHEVIEVDHSQLGVARIKIRNEDGTEAWLTLDASRPVNLEPPF